MAIFMEEENRRLRCEKCGSVLFREEKIYAYTIVDNGTKHPDMESIHDHTRIVCMKCENVVSAMNTRSKITKKGDN